MGSAAYGKWMCTCAAKTSLEKRVANLEKQVRDLIKKKKKKNRSTSFSKGNTMLSIPESINHLDANGRPAGGTVRGVGLSIDWQNGPLGRDGERIPPNGAFVETVIYAALQRIEHYQSGQFKCRENALAVTKLEEALHWLNARTTRREVAKVEGTHNGN